MTLTINGEPRTTSARTLSDLLAELGMKPDRVAVELNREIVPRDRWSQTQLNDGDQLEIVHFVGGGSPVSNGSLDKHIPKADVEKVQARHPDVEIFWYDSDHGFNCNDRSAYNPAAARLARERSLAFLKKQLLQ